MPARTLNDFFAGFFYRHESRLEVKMEIALDKGQTNSGVKVIKAEGEREEEKEVIVRREMVSLKWKTWNYDNFSHDWNKNYSV
jgi:hypothetical protein